jgi:hypothetical protein
VALSRKIKRRAPKLLVMNEMEALIESLCLEEY